MDTPELDRLLYDANATNEAVEELASLKRGLDTSRKQARAVLDLRAEDLHRLREEINGLRGELSSATIALSEAKQELAQCASIINGMPGWDQEWAEESKLLRDARELRWLFENQGRAIKALCVEPPKMQAQSSQLTATEAAMRQHFMMSESEASVRLDGETQS